MLGKQITLCTIFGVRIHIGPIWMILAPLIAWSLAQKAFPYYYEGLSTTSYWWMGVIGALGLLASLVFHELWHSLIARNVGISEQEVTVYLFGGTAGMEEEPPTPKAEFFLGIAGPLASIILGGIFYGMSVVGAIGNWSRPVLGVMSFLSVFNALLALFNLVPAFSLDGGRILRAALWNWKDNLHWATRIVFQIDTGVGIALIVVGLSIMSRSFMYGMWSALLGLFLLQASKRSYQQFLVQQLFEHSASIFGMRHTPGMTIKHS